MASLPVLDDSRIEEIWGALSEENKKTWEKEHQSSLLEKSKVDDENQNKDKNEISNENKANKTDNLENIEQTKENEPSCLYTFLKVDTN